MTYRHRVHWNLQYNWTMVKKRSRHGPFQSFFSCETVSVISIALAFQVKESLFIKNITLFLSKTILPFSVAAFIQSLPFANYSFNVSFTFKTYSVVAIPALRGFFYFRWISIVQIVGNFVWCDGILAGVNILS